MLFTDEDEAIIWVEASEGAVALMASLFNVADWRENGSISSDEKLKREWLWLRPAQNG